MKSIRVKQKLNREQGNNLVQIAVAFFAGIVVTAIVAQTPVVAEILSPQFIPESVIPAVQDTPDSLKPDYSDTTTPVKQYMTELVWTSIEKAVLSC